MFINMIQTGRLKPVEYKRGKPKPDPMDEIQLCAQGLCLEEMTGQTVSEGALWYMQTRHRVPIVFSDDLCAQTLATIAAVRELLNSGQTPPPAQVKNRSEAGRVRPSPPFCAHGRAVNRLQAPTGIIFRAAGLPGPNAFTNQGKRHERQ